MGIVGARAADVAAVRVAHQLGLHVGRGGGVVVSGGALGVDGAAHQGALDAGAPTTVVLGSGVDVVYPDRHRALFSAVVAGGGALVSMFPLGTRPRAGNFVARNRVIAALADLVVVVSASMASGSLHTARHAVALGRTLAAVPGSPGTDALLAAGAVPVVSPDDLDRALAGEVRRIERPALDGDLARAYAALDARVGRDVAELAAALGCSLARAASLLSDLEATGWTLEVPGAAYVRAP